MRNARKPKKYYQPYTPQQLPLFSQYSDVLAISANSLFLLMMLWGILPSCHGFSLFLWQQFPAKACLSHNKQYHRYPRLLCEAFRSRRHNDNSRKGSAGSKGIGGRSS